MTAARAISARAAARTGSALGLELERHLAVLVDLSVKRLVVKGDSRIGLDEHVHVGFLDDLVAGLRAVRQRQRQPARAAVFWCNAQPSFRRKPGLGGQVADSSHRMVGKRKHAELLTRYAWMTEMLCCALRRGLRRNTCRGCVVGRGAGPGPSTIALTTGAAAHCSLSRPREVKPAISRALRGRVPQAERSPGSPWGGDGVAGAPPLTRLVTRHAGNLEPGFSKKMPCSAQAHK